ncbi:MAG: hypothetical protein MUF54_22845 [Polyangiaceae bacterium]|nr:hypothetical protein [Polyangiaceae bacterium]
MTTALTELHAVHVQDELGAIRGMSVSLPAGLIGALVGGPQDGTTALAAALAGQLRPRSGSLLVGGLPPYRSPSIRRRIGALLHAPHLPDVGRVKHLLAIARQLRGGEAPRDTWHELLLHGRLDEVPIASLDETGRRTVALALALAVPNPALLVLHEPVVRTHVTCARWLRELLRARAEQGTCVLVLTASTQDASALADDVGMLQGGAIARAIGVPSAEALAPGSAVELQVWCNLPRVLVSALVLEPSVHGATYAEGDGGTPVRLRTEDLEQCAARVAAIASHKGVQLKAMRVVMPSTPEVNAATARLAVAARYRAACSRGKAAGPGGGAA